MLSFSDTTLILEELVLLSTSCDLQRVLNETRAKVARALVTTFSYFSFQIFILCYVSVALTLKLISFS